MVQIEKKKIKSLINDNILQEVLKGLTSEKLFTLISNQ